MIWPAAHSFQPGLPLAVLASARCRAQVGLRALSMVDRCRAE
jgi:hypothetical protein